jgi:hypothetical protein
MVTRTIPRIGAVRPEAVAAALDRSDERARALRLRLAAWAEGFRIGRETGRREGRELAEREMAAAWTRAASPAASAGPSHAELELRRWGPGGRARFGEPRPGDYPGRPA